MQLRDALLAVTVLATPIAASAQPVTGLYVGLGAGGNFTQKENINGAGVGLQPIFSQFFNTNGNIGGSAGFAGVVNLGWGFGNGLRAEVEGNYRSNQSGFAHGNSNFGAGGGSTEHKYGGMVNVLYDFNGLTPWFVPYLGVGVGYVGINEDWNAFNRFQFTVPPGALTAPGRTFNSGTARASGNSTEGSFAYQAILGAAFPLPQVTPGLAITAEYRFLGTSANRTYNGRLLAGSTSGEVFAAPASIRLGASYNHSLLVGLRYSFGVAPAAAAGTCADTRCGSGPLLSGVLRLGQVLAHRQGAPDHPGSGREFDQGAVHADRGERLHRHIGHAEVQPGSVDASSQCGQG